MWAHSCGKLPGPVLGVRVVGREISSLTIAAKRSTGGKPDGCYQPVCGTAACLHGLCV